MTGPEHYNEAQRLAGENGEWYYVAADDVPQILARAQVHATLALAAAIAEAGVMQMTANARTAWHETAQVAR
jgi:hypothetical protein